MVNYPYTYSTDNNTWTTDYYEKVTIDYLMAKGNTYHPKGTIQLKVDFSDVKVEDLKTENNNSFSDHNAVSSKIKLSCQNQ